MNPKDRRKWKLSILESDNLNLQGKEKEDYIHAKYDELKYNKPLQKQDIPDLSEVLVGVEITPDEIESLLTELEPEVLDSEEEKLEKEEDVEKSKPGRKKRV